MPQKIVASHIQDRRFFERTDRLAWGISDNCLVLEVDCELSIGVEFGVGESDIMGYRIAGGIGLGWGSILSEAWLRWDFYGSAYPISQPKQQGQNVIVNDAFEITNRIRWCAWACWAWSGG